MAVYLFHRAHEKSHICVGDDSHMVILCKTSPRPAGAIVFHVKPAILNFFLSFLCGPPFMPVTEPRVLTMGLNLISVLIWSNQLSYDRS